MRAVYAFKPTEDYFIGNGKHILYKNKRYLAMRTENGGYKIIVRGGKWCTINMALYEDLMNGKLGNKVKTYIVKTKTDQKNLITYLLKQLKMSIYYEPITKLGLKTYINMQGNYYYIITNNAEEYVKPKYKYLNDGVVTYFSQKVSLKPYNHEFM